MGLSLIEPILTAGPWALIALALIYAVPRLIVAVVALFKIPPERLPAVLKALGELFRIGSWFRRP
ncbi:twin-arginine translocase TatA/TatE family subunit [Micromonospora chalcea]